MVFDVESVGLHGEGYAVGFVVIDRERNILDQGMFSCPINAARGNEKGFEWCRVHAEISNPTHTAPWLVRASFWRKWREWQERGAILAADTPWPVEAHFLEQCVEDNPVEREWQGPYPLLDVTSVLMVRGKDPIEKGDRLANEIPEHNPLCDARQSARLLLDNLTV